MIDTTKLSTQDVQRMTDAALAHAGELGVAVTIAVVDDGGHVRGLVRMDGATYFTSDLALTKARTAASFGAATDQFAKVAADNPALLTVMSGQPDIAILPGGIPVVAGEAIIGAVGVSGGPAGEDLPIAEAALTAIG